MRRRQYLAGATAFLAANSGCTAIKKVVGEGTSNTLGDSIEHRDVEVTPDVYTTASEVQYDMADINHSPTEQAPQGATYLLTRLSVEHIGENERLFPRRGSTSQEHIKNFYKGERLSTGRYEDTANAFIVDGNRLSGYLRQLFKNNQTSPVYSGSASGWLVNEIPDGFTPEDATIEITWGAGSSLYTEDENLSTYSWSYTSDARVEPSEAPQSVL